MKRLISAALLPAVAACSSAGRPGTPAGGAALAYATAGAFTYEIVDTAQIVMDVMGQTVQVAVRSASTVGLDLTRSGSGLAGTMTFESLSGEFTNSMGPSMTISDSDMPDPTELTVDARGMVTVTSRPELSTIMRQVFGSESYVQRMFVRLPGRAVTAGTMWTDTITISDDAGGMSTEITSVVASTFRGDTTVAGTRLWIVDSDISSTQRVSGEQQGVEIRQTVTGTSTAVTLWDPARGMVAERRETGTGTGSMELPAMGMSGIPVNVRQTQVMRLRR